MKVFKKFLKYSLIGFAALITAGVLVAIFGDDDAEKATTTPAVEEAKAEEPAKKEEKKAEPKKVAKKETNDPELTKAEFAKIKNGMTIEEVQKIIGSEGELQSEVGAEGDSTYTVMYTYEGSAFGSNANVTFQGNPAKVAMKAQFGLK